MDDSTLSILLIEDDPDYGPLLRRLYAQQPDLRVQVIHRKRLRSALNYLTSAENRPALVLLDLHLPDSYDQRATFHQVQTAAGDCPILILTGEASESQGAALVEAGAQDYLDKMTLDAESLIRATRHALKRQERVSQLNRLAAAAHDAEARLRLMIEASVDGMLLLDREGRIRFANPAMCVMLGRARPDDLIGETFGYPMITGEAALIDILRPDMTRALAEMRLVNFEQAGGGGFLATFRDVTEREQNAEALRQSNERFRSLIYSSPDTLLSITHPAGHLTLHRDSFLGYSKAEIEDEAIVRAAHPDDRPILMQHWADLLASNPQTVITATYRLFSAAGALEWVQARGIVSTRALDGSPREVLVTLSVVTAARLAEERLKESEARFRLLADSAPVIIWVTQRDGTLDYVNQAWTDLTGKSLAQTRQAGGLLAFVHPDDMADTQALYAMATGAQQPFESAFRLIRPDGETAWVLCHGVPRKVAGDDTNGYIGSIVDMTQRKLAEQAALDMAVERRQLEVIEQFIEDATHEFRTPLSIINSNVYLAQRIHDPERRRRYLNEIHEQVEAIAGLIEALVTMLQLDGQHDFASESLPVSSLVQTVKTRISPRAQAKQITLSITIPEQLPAIHGSRRYLDMALYNVLDNAIRYTPAGGSVTVRAGWHNSGHVAISVRDTGTGMSPEVLARAFDPFYRQDEAHSTRGFGLGLTIAQRVVMLHGGVIEAESTPNEGSVFTIILPRDDAAPPEETASPPAAGTPDGGA